MVTVVWPSGQVDSAPNWSALLNRLNLLPWNSHLDAKEFRLELAHRAYVWCGEPVVHPEARPRDLFAQLEEAHMLRIVQRAEDPWKGKAVSPWLRWKKAA